MLPHGFAFGSCRIRFMECPYCVTVLSSLTQVSYWLDVIEGKRQPPATPELRELISYEQANDEPWKYDWENVRSVIVEVCTAKTLWYGEHPVSLLGNHRRGTLGAQTRLVVATAAELYAEMRALRQRLMGRFVVFLCQQTHQSDAFSLYYATLETRHAVKDLIFKAASELPDCAAYDPTPRIAELGAEKCLFDVHHWTPFGGAAFAKDIENLVPEEYR